MLGSAASEPVGNVTTVTTNMIKQLRPAVLVLLLLTVLTGLLYPLAVTGVAQVVFPSQANGSLIVARRQGRGLGA